MAKYNSALNFGDDDIINATKNVGKRKQSEAEDAECLELQLKARKISPESMLSKNNQRTLSISSEIIQQNSASANGIKKPILKESRLPYGFKSRTVSPLLHPLSGLTQPTIRSRTSHNFSPVQRIYDEQLKTFTSALQIESEVFRMCTAPSSFAHLKPLSISTQLAADAIPDSKLITKNYLDHIQNWKALNPLEVLIDGFCFPNPTQANCRSMELRINRVFAECSQKTKTELSNLISNHTIENEQPLAVISAKMEETGRQIFRQMKQYMDFLSGSRPNTGSITSTKISPVLDRKYNSKEVTTNHSLPNNNRHRLPNLGSVFEATEISQAKQLSSNGNEIPNSARKLANAAEDSINNSVGSKNIKFITKQANGKPNQGTYSPTPTELEETALKPEINPKVSATKEDNITEADSDATQKKKKRKRKKSKSDKKEHKKKKKEKKKEKSGHELPKAYASNNNYVKERYEPPFIRHRLLFRKHNYNNYNFRGFRGGFRHNQNFRFQNRNSWQRNRVNYTNEFHRRPFPASRRRNVTRFVSESSSDDESSRTQTKSRSPKKTNMTRKDSSASEKPEDKEEKCASEAKNDDEKRKMEGTEQDDDSSHALNLLSEYI